MPMCWLLAGFIHSTLIFLSFMVLHFKKCPSGMSHTHHEEHRWFEQVDFHKVYRKDGSAMTHGQPAEITCIFVIQCSPVRKQKLQQVLKWYGMVVYRTMGNLLCPTLATRFDLKPKKSTSQSQRSNFFMLQMKCFESRSLGCMKCSLKNNTSEPETPLSRSRRGSFPIFHLLILSHLTESQQTSLPTQLEIGSPPDFHRHSWQIFQPATKDYKDSCKVLYLLNTE